MVDVTDQATISALYTHVQQDLATRAPVRYLGKSVPLPLVAVVSNAGIACISPVELMATDK